jgi:hypothetical protein
MEGGSKEEFILASNGGGVCAGRHFLPREARNVLRSLWSLLGLFIEGIGIQEQVFQVE